MLRRWQLTLAIALATVAVNVALYIAIPKGFFPQQDTGMLAGTVQAPQDTSYHALSAMMTDFVHTLLTDPAIDSVVGVHRRRRDRRELGPHVHRAQTACGEEGARATR